MYWPIFYFFFVPQFLIFFFCIAVSLPHFILLPVCSPSLSLSFQHPFPPLSDPYFPCPCLHSLSPFPLFMLWAWTNVPRTNLPQLTALNHDPWPPHHSAGTTLRMDDLFISALPRLSSLLVLRCLLFSPSKDGYAPKSVYPLRYVIVSTILLLLIWFWFHLNSYL